MRNPEDLYQRIIEQQLSLIQPAQEPERPDIKKTGWMIPLIAGLAYASGRGNANRALRALVAGLGSYAALRQPQAQNRQDEKMLEFRRKVLEDLRQSADTVRRLRERNKIGELTQQLLGGDMAPEDYIASMASLGEIDKASSLVSRMTELTVLPNGKAIISYPGGVKSVVDLYDPNDTADLAVAAAALRQSGNKDLADDIQRIIEQGKKSLSPGRYRATDRGLRLVESFNKSKAAQAGTQAKIQVATQAEPQIQEPDFYMVDENGTLRPPDVPSGIPVAEEPRPWIPDAPSDPAMAGGTRLSIPDVPGGLALAGETRPSVPDVPGGLALAGETRPSVPDVPGGLAVIANMQQPRQPQEIQRVRPIRQAQQAQQIQPIQRAQPIQQAQQDQPPRQVQQQEMPTLIPKSIDLGPVKLRAANIVTEDKPAWRPIYENGRLVRVEFAPVGTPLRNLSEKDGWNYGEPPFGWDQPKLLESRIRAAERSVKLWKQIIHTIFKEDGTLNEDALAGLIGYTNSPFPTWVAKTDRPYTKEAEKLISLIRPFIMNIVYAKSGKQTAVAEFDNWMNTILPDAMNSSPVTAWMKLKAFEQQMLLPPLQEGEVGLEDYFTDWESPLDQVMPVNDESVLDSSDMIKRFGKGILDEVSKLIFGSELESGFLTNWIRDQNVVPKENTPQAIQDLRELGRNKVRRGRKKKKEDLRKGRIIRE